MERRKRLVNVLGCLSVAFVFAGCVEGLDGGITLWNFISLAVAFLLGMAAKWLNEHVQLTNTNDEEEGEK